MGHFQYLGPGAAAAVEPLIFTSVDGPEADSADRLGKSEHLERWTNALLALVFSWESLTITYNQPNFLGMG